METKKDMVDDSCIAIKEDPKKLSKIGVRKNKDVFYEKLCRVINYNHRTKELDILFDKYGIRIKNVENFNGDTVTVKYKGEIGNQNFLITI